MKKFIVLAALGAALIGTATLALAQEPDHNGDVHSNCHTGSKFRGAGGNDKDGGCSTEVPATAIVGATATATPQAGVLTSSIHPTPVVGEHHQGQVGGSTSITTRPGSQLPSQLPNSGDGTCANGC